LLRNVGSFGGRRPTALAPFFVRTLPDPQYEQQLWEECSRLITNCIIYYNATLLSHLLTHKERHGDAAGAALLTHVSPVAWQHINLCGRYEFTKGANTINIAAIIQALAQAPVPQTLAL
jgi:Tn3 transposase DDE domain